MLRSKRTEILAASMLMAPFVVTYGVLFIYPTIKMAQLSLTNAPLIGPGKWVGFDNYFRLASDRLFSLAIWNTLYFVILSVIPSTLLGLVVALGVVVGIALVFAVGRLLSNLLYGIGGSDPVTIFSVTILLGFVAFLACWWPARRASGVDPVVALRSE